MAEFQSLDGDQFPDGENSSEKASKLFAEENSGEPTKSLKGSLTPLKASVVHHNVQERPKVLTKTAQSGRLLPRMSEQNLLDILRMIPPDAFLEIMSNKERFKATVFDEGKSIEMVALLILVLGKLHKVVLKHNLQSLMDQIFASNTVLRDDILDYVKYVVYLEQKGQLHTIPEADRVWESLETFCSFGKRIEKRANIWAEITDALCGILQGKKEESLVKKHSVFLQLKNAMEGGYFYPGSIYACVADLKEEPMPKLPEFQGGKCSDVKEYLNFQMAHTKTHFLTKLYNGLQEFQKLDEEEKSRVVLKNIGGTNIFPAVRIYRKFPFSVPVNDKYLLVDLAPQSRVNRQLPKDVQKEITDEEFMLETESVLFLSTSSAFEDMIVARLTYLPMEVQAQGYLYVNIVELENIKNNILNRDLFLVTIPMIFSSKTFLLRALKQIPTSLFPIKEHLIDCQKAETLPDYENLTEYDCSFEKINVRAEVLKDEHWRSLGMHEQQFEAFQTALTRNVTAIEGPPGTGKAFVALSIIQRLLANTSSRILIVSSGNYSLDKLLLLCSMFTHQIVRIGWQFDDPEVEKFALKKDFNDYRYNSIKSMAFCQCKLAVDKFNNAISQSKDKTTNFEQELKEMCEANHRLDELQLFRMYYGSRKARIIGITMTGAAKYRKLLELLRPPIVIINNAFHMSDSHIITALTEHTQQVIFFGDYGLQKRYKCTIGLGEDCLKAKLCGRLIDNDLNNVRLRVQHRMHPDISNLLRETLYPDIVDGEKVRCYGSIRGIPKHLFWVSLDNLDAVREETFDILLKNYPDVNVHMLSKQNLHTMFFCVGLANFLTQQGYNYHEIVILTIVGDEQIATLSAMQHFPALKNVPVSTVDSFEGKECRIAIVMLLQCSENAVDLLLTEKRISSFLTRSREGLFIVGQLDFFAEKSELCKDIREKLQTKDAIGPGLPIKCEKHRSEMIATGLEDFCNFTHDGCPAAEGFRKAEKHPCLDI